MNHTQDAQPDVQQNGTTPNNQPRPKRFDRSQCLQDGISPSLMEKLRRPFRALIAEHPTLRAPIVDGLFRERDTVNIISNSKAGKSWLSYGLALSVIMGRPWFGRFPVTPSKVLLIDNELHPDDLTFRLPAVAKEMKIDEQDYAGQLEVWPMRGMGFDIHKIWDLLKHVNAGTRPLIIIDSKYRFLPAGNSENANEHETAFYNAIDRMAETLRSAFVLIHHDTKGDSSSKRVTDIGAGGGAQARAADCHIVLREHADDNRVVFDAALRSFPPVDQLVLRWQFPLWLPDEGADPSRLGKPTRSERKQGERDTDADAEILEAAESWVSHREIRKATGMGPQRVNRALKRLLKAGQIEKSEAERKGNKCTVFKKTA